VGQAHIAQPVSQSKMAQPMAHPEMVQPVAQQSHSPQFIAVPIHQVT